MQIGCIRTVSSGFCVIIENMLIINEELLAIDQAIDCLVSYFLMLPEVDAYRLSRQQFENDKETPRATLCISRIKG